MRHMRRVRKATPAADLVEPSRIEAQLGLLWHFLRIPTVSSQATSCLKTVAWSAMTTSANAGRPSADALSSAANAAARSTA